MAPEDPRLEALRRAARTLLDREDIRTALHTLLRTHDEMAFEALQHGARGAELEEAAEVIRNNQRIRNQLRAFANPEDRLDV